jgi:glyoxylase-like metal-dependent hydrolase (beta-lactamase superfamily II)
VSRSLGLLSLVLALGCTARSGPLHDPPRAVAVLTDPSGSMIYLARVESGVIALDLGWVAAGTGLRRGLAEQDADPDDVDAVCLTHSHLDHVAGWPLVRGASFHLAASEVPRFLGSEHHRGWVPRLASLLPENLPEAGEIAIEPFASDTTFTLGADTLRAFLVPGHTAGSAAYLFRGILFVGDAMSWKPFGLRSPMRIHSDDTAEGRRSLESLWRRVEPFDVRWVCTAHARCIEFTPELIDTARRADSR